MSGPVAIEVLEVVDGGVEATIQDAGRPNAARLGVPPGGACDPMGLAIANVLVGNACDRPALEVFLGGTALRALVELTLGVGGGDLGLVRGTGERVEPGEAISVTAGDALRFTGGPDARAYLAVPGGFVGERVLGSVSTLVAAGFGGHGGRVLAGGDRLAAPVPALLPEPLPWPTTGGPSRRHEVRILRGPHARPAGGSLEALTGGAWRVASADRMALRLDGPPIDTGTVELPSHGVTFGTIQLPADGRPIVLLADHQTTGGYPVIAVAISADRSVLAQLRPGDDVTFRPVSLADAVAALRALREALAAGERAVREAAAWDDLWRSAQG
ncbi:MAG: biotin-dependent carboxyltransferase family protein [Chloroflexota bacterium]